MKKIILAVASVLALGMLVSCKQEISGEIDVNSHSKETSYSKTFYYTVEGGESWTTTNTYASKASAIAAEVAGGSSETKYEVSLNNGNNGVTLSFSENPTTNTVTYTYTFPTVKTVSTTTQTSTAGTKTYYAPTTSYNYSKTIVITKIDGKYYWTTSASDKIILKNFNPTADVIDFSVLADKDVKSETLTGATYSTTTGALESYTTKATTKSGATSYTWKLTKVK